MTRVLILALPLLLGGCGVLNAFLIPAAAGFAGTVTGNIASDKIEGK